MLRDTVAVSMLRAVAMIAIVLIIAPIGTVGSEDATPGFGTPNESGSIPSSIATIPRIRVFCSPCIDSYAQEIFPRSVAWGSDRVDAAVAPGWRREDGALRIARPFTVERGAPDGAGRTGAEARSAATLLIDGGAFDPATVYVFVDDSWQNLAILFDLPAERALPTLESYIPVQRAPIQGHLPGEEAW
jgi:hypothetical protein